MALSKLQKLPHLDRTLVASLAGKNRLWALEVMAALGKKEFIAPLLREAQKDGDGFLVLTLNSLMTSDRKNEILSVYRAALRDHKTLAPATLVAMLEPFGRLESLPIEVLRPLAKHPFPEVQSSVLSYYRRRFLQKGEGIPDFILHDFSQSKTKQIQLQTLFLMQELATAEKGSPVRKDDLLQELQENELSPAGSAISIRYVFGYKDARPARFVGDRHERLAFVQTLLKPCQKSLKVCGFKRDLVNADLFRKLRSDGVVIELQVVHSSADSDDVWNRKNPFQVWQSQNAERVFLSGILGGSHVIYNGHSRSGGGPDFDPPRLRKNDSIDLAFYQKEKPGLTKIKSTLKKRLRKGSVGSSQSIELVSCSSEQHFLKELQQSLPSSLSAAIQIKGNASILHYSEALKKSLLGLAKVMDAPVTRPTFRAAGS